MALLYQHDLLPRIIDFWVLIVYKVPITMVEDMESKINKNLYMGINNINQQALASYR